jgi:indolepyruvate ferredoxin oxidoreductase beta subunit
VIAFDMEAMAKARGSVISATMFGALAGSGQLPFQRSAFEGAIRAGGAGVEASLAAFGAAYEQTGVKPIEAIRHGPEKYFVGWPDHAGNEELDRIGDRIRAFPGVAQPMLATGARKLVDYLDPTYAIEYLDRIGALMELDRACGGEAKGYAFTVTAAKYLATAMAYDDVPRVADLKIRASRQARVRQEVQAAPDTIVTTTEYFHPRVDELCGSLPKALGEWVEARPGLVSFLRTYVDRGRRIRVNTIAGYLMLAFVASRGPKRRGTLRHAREMKHIESWLEVAQRALKARYELGVGVLGCRRLVKGYSDTHARGLSKFDRVMTAAPALMSREDGADWLDRLKRAALADEQGDALNGVLKTIATL